MSKDERFEEWYQQTYGVVFKNEGPYIDKFRIRRAYLAALASERERVANHNGCLLTGPGRGDCLHFLGQPTAETPTDEYGKPTGWCWFCWLTEKRQIKMEMVAEVIKKLRYHISNMPFSNDMRNWRGEALAILTSIEKGE